MSLKDLFNISRKDLESIEGHYFQWESGPYDDETVRNGKDGNNLNKRQGYEVLSYVNDYCNQSVIIKKDDRLAVARKILNDAPSDVSTFDEYDKWLDQFDFGV
ncbi:hypothetical protein [Fodinibius sp. SL11]|uniref:hypothetical protein n=1 Tax=Fodinibius sp. SL11 TaxID=3425690 RepID=UPI003F885EE0